MNAIAMIQRCARHGSPRGPGLWLDATVSRHDEQECQQMGEKAQRRATQTPNLLVWTGRSHLLAIEFKEEVTMRRVLIAVVALTSLVASLCGISTPATAGGVAAGDILVADPNAGPVGQGALIKVNPTNGAQTTLSSGGLPVEPMGSARAADGDLFVADPSSGPSGAVLRVNAVTGSQSVRSTSRHFSVPVALGIEGMGQLLVVDV